MIKAPDPSAGITEIPDQTKEPQPTPHHDVANMQVKDLQQLVHEGEEDGVVIHHHDMWVLRA